MRSLKYALAAIVAVFGVTLAAQKSLPLQPFPPTQKVAAGNPVSPPPAGGAELDADNVNAWLDGYHAVRARTAATSPARSWRWSRTARS